MNFGLENVEISFPPKGLETKFLKLFTTESVSFVCDLVSVFQYRTKELFRARKLQKLGLDDKQKLPKFAEDSSVSKKDWKISSLPARLLNRHLDLGDVSPSNSQHFKTALMSKVQGIQVDFDDGHCPTWSNMIEGLHNIVSFTKGQFFPNQVPSLEKAPILMLRPRAWNMNEHNFRVNGREIPGPLLDFGLLMFHIGKICSRNDVGPYFYLSKLEGRREARLWNDIFIWTQASLGIPIGTIKACVLIENIMASFEMEEILYELKEHSLGLNCGIWDYCASFVNKFGDRPDFLLPDRNKYVNMEKHFLDSYMKLVVKTCHKRGAPATGGMAAQTMKQINENGKSQRCQPKAVDFTSYYGIHKAIIKRLVLTRNKELLANNLSGESDNLEIIEKVCKAKLREIHAGVDGFMVYDATLVPWMNDLWQRFGSNSGPNQIFSITHPDLKIKGSDLLKIPKGGVTFDGLKHNIKVGVVFIYSWIANGKGHFFLDGAVEDSATAEISRSQVWQWIYHQARLEDSSKEKITKTLVTQLTKDFYEQEMYKTNFEVNHLHSACQIFLEIVTSVDFPEFITTYLYNHSVFRSRHNT